MNSLNSNLFISFHHQCPVNSSMIHISFCLYIEYSSNTRFNQFLDIIILLWILTKPAICFSNFIKHHPANKISISFFNVSIYNVYLVYIFPLSVSFLAKLASIYVLMRILNLDTSSGFSLPYCIICKIISNGILVLDLFRMFSLIEFHRMRPRVYWLTSQPNYLSKWPLHPNWAKTTIPIAEQISSSINSHMLFIVIFKRVINGEINCISFPFIKLV